MTKITIPTLAAAISLAVFACTESPSSSDDTESSSSGNIVSPSSSSKTESSSSGNSSSKNAACKYTGEQFGLSSALFACEEDKNVYNLQERKEECIEEGGTFVDACPSGEKHTCISDEEEYENLILKIYANDVACGDFNLKNADGSESIVPKGGACGPFSYIQGISICSEIPEIPTFLVKATCSAELEVPFVNECPSNADLVCSKVENGIKYVFHYYSESLSGYSCNALGMEDL